MILQVIPLNAVYGVIGLIIWLFLSRLSCSAVEGQSVRDMVVAQGSPGAHEDSLVPHRAFLGPGMHHGTLPPQQRRYRIPGLVRRGDHY